MIIQEIFSVLGLKVDKGSFAKGEQLLGGTAKLLAGIGIAVGLDQIHDMIQGVADMADHAGKAGQKLGITTEAVQELGYAAKLSDIEQEELEGSLVKLAKGLNDVATTGKGPAADALKSLGVHARDLKGESLDQNLEVIADAFAKMPDGPKKAAAAIDLFGKSGTKMIPFLNGGAKGIVDLRNEAQRLGIVVDGETAKGFEEFNDQQTRLSETLRGFKVQVVSAMLPALMKLAEAARTWIEENREMLKSLIDIAAKGFVAVIKGVAVALTIVTKVIQWFQKHSDIAIAIIIALGLVIAVFAIEAAIAWVIAFFPLFLVIAIIAAIVLVVMDLWRSITTGKGVAADVFRTIKRWASDFWDFLKSLPDKLIELWKTMAIFIVKTLSDAFDAIVEKSKTAMRDAWNAVADSPLGSLLGGALDIGGGKNSIATGVVNWALGPSAPTTQSQSVAPAGGGGPAGFMASFGPTTITVQGTPGMDEAKVAELAAKESRKQNELMVSDAFEAFRGGKR